MYNERQQRSTVQYVLDFILQWAMLPYIQILPRGTVSINSDEFSPESKSPVKAQNRNIKRSHKSCGSFTPKLACICGSWKHWGHMAHGFSRGAKNRLLSFTLPVDKSAFSVFSFFFVRKVRDSRKDRPRQTPEDVKTCLNQKHSTLEKVRDVTFLSLSP